MRLKEEDLPAATSPNYDTPMSSAAPRIRSGGNIAKSVCAFSADGSFIFCPQGREISVLSSTTGARIASLNPSHTAQIKAVVKFNIDIGQSEDFFASLDYSNTICIWALALGRRLKKPTQKSEKLSNSAQRKIPNFRLRFLTKFSLDDLEFPDDISNLSRHKIQALHASSGVLHTKESACLIIILSSRLTNDKSKNEPLSEEEVSKPQNDVIVIAEIYELKLIDLLFEKVKVERLFIAGLEPIKKNANPNSYNPITSAVDPRGEYIAVCLSRMLYVWHRGTDSLFSSYHKEILTTVAIQPDYSRLATGDTSGRVTWWFVLDKFYTNNLKETSFKDGTTAHNNNISGLRIQGKGVIIPTGKVIGDAILSLKKNSELNQLNVKNVEFTIAILHWHSHPVKALAFHGIHLISGGQEGVLVFWSTTQVERHFVPRLKAPILRVACADKSNSIVVCLADNSIGLIDPSVLELKATYQSIQLPLSLLKGQQSYKPDNVCKNKHDTIPVSIIPFRTSPAFTPALFVGSGVTFDGIGPNSVIQVYDMMHDKSLGSFNVVTQSFVSRDKSRRQQWTLQQVAINGCQLATVEFRRSLLPPCIDELCGQNLWSTNVSRNTPEKIKPAPTPCEDNCIEKNDDIHQLKKLKDINYKNVDSKLNGSFTDHEWQSGRYYLIKFWHIEINDENTGFKKNPELLLSIDSPHTHDITFLCPITRNDNKCDFLTASLDGTWKIWRLYENPRTYTCSDVNSYKTLPCLSGSISQDSSLLGLGHSGCVSIWDCRSPKLLCSIPAPRVNKKNMRVCWIEASYKSDEKGGIVGERLFLIATQSSVWIWDFKLAKPQLIYCLQLQESNSILQFDPNGAPRFHLLEPRSQNLITRIIIRNKDGSLNCKKTNILCGKKELGSQSLLGFTMLQNQGKSFAAFLDSTLQLRIFCILENDQESLKLSEVITPEKSNQRYDNKNNDNDDNKDDNKNDKIKKKQSETNFLSNFIIKTRPLLIKSYGDSNQIKSIIGQSNDGISYLAPPPSIIYKNIVSLYNQDL